MYLHPSQGVRNHWYTTMKDEIEAGEPAYVGDCLLGALDWWREIAQDKSSDTHHTQSCTKRRVSPESMQVFLNEASAGFGLQNARLSYTTRPDVDAILSLYIGGGRAVVRGYSFQLSSCQC